MVKYMSRASVLTASFFLITVCSQAQPLNKKQTFTHQDTLRGTVTPERAWWNVYSYNIYVVPDYKAKTIKGWNQLIFTAPPGPATTRMQIDLQEPMKIDSINFEGAKFTKYRREGNV